MFNAKLIKTEENNNILEDEKYIDILKKALNLMKIPENYYCLSGYSEEAICLEFCSIKCLWIVYDGERGNKYNVMSYTQILSACDDIISRISIDEHERQRITTIFKVMHCKYSHILDEINEVNKRINELKEEQLKKDADNDILQKELTIKNSEKRKLLRELKKLDPKYYASIFKK